MKTLKYFSSTISTVFVVVLLSVTALAQVEDRGIASLSGGPSSVRFDVLVPHSAATLTVNAPDGQSFVKEFKGGSSVDFRLLDAAGEKLPDGSYTYELRVAPIFSAEVKEALKSARAKGNEGEVLRDLKRRGALPSQPTVQAGNFLILNGSIVAGGRAESGDQDTATLQHRPSSVVASARSTGSMATPTVPTRRSSYQIPRHHPSLPFFDFVIADDLIVQGSACVGLDCVNGENFGFDTIRVKENNTRIQFDDTSTSAGFATNNWQIRANSSASGGGSFLAFVDQGATGNSETGTIVFEVDAGAPANSLRVSSGGNIGIGTATPVLDVHANTTDTPAIRLEQNNTGGFTAQTWDIAGNEANFFVRDVTSGSRLPFRIRPGAPTSSLDIAANGNVGIATASPSAPLDVFGNTFLVGSDDGTANRTNNTVKISRVSSPPFTTTNLNFAYTGAVTNASDNVAAVGGGFSGFSASTVVAFFTAANTNTATGTERMRITSIGRVGIGTAAPDQLLSVNGDASKVGGGSWQNFSDERLKTFRGNFSRGLSAVMQLQPLRYEYRSNNALGLKSEGEHIGFGAQSVRQVIPEAVTANSNGYLMVNNDPIIWTMLNAIKEQQKEIVELKRQIRQLRAHTRKRR
ncbi:MAG TPA: tail fiber domain-containing protein [Pyrinomonadaceae bacterium]|nr:tail fiber domain-containing protein [Pyrinomonadaceae bacterium]